MDFQSAMETFAEAWVAANTQTPLTEAAEAQALALSRSNEVLPSHEILIEKDNELDGDGTRTIASLNRGSGHDPLQPKIVLRPTTITAKSIPVHCLVEQVPSPQNCDQSTELQPTLELDSYAIIPSHTLFSELVRAALFKLGYASSDIVGAKGAIQIKNWKPLSFETITEDSNATVGEILGELTTVATLRIRLYRTSSVNPQRVCRPHCSNTGVAAGKGSEGHFISTVPPTHLGPGPGHGHGHVHGHVVHGQEPMAGPAHMVWTCPPNRSTNITKSSRNPPPTDYDPSSLHLPYRTSAGFWEWFQARDVSQWNENTVKYVVVQLLKEMSQIRLASICPLSQPLISNINNGKAGVRVGKEKCAEFGRWYVQYRESIARQGYAVGNDQLCDASQGTKRKKCRRKKKFTCSKIMWSTPEKEVIFSKFQNHIKEFKVPQQNECLECLRSSNCFHIERDWKSIKYYVYNQILKAKKKM